MPRLLIALFLGLLNTPELSTLSTEEARQPPVLCILLSSQPGRELVGRGCLATEVQIRDRPSGLGVRDSKARLVGVWGRWSGLSTCHQPSCTGPSHPLI